MIPTFGFSAIFGTAVSIEHTPNANAQQVAAFFGVSGYQTLTGGARGRAFMVKGLLPGINPGACVQAELLLLQYADGIARVLIDPMGVEWPNVVFQGQYQRAGPFMVNCSYGGWVLPYKAVLNGLT